MKKHLGIIFLATIALLCSCRHKCDDIVKPSNLKPIDWNGWNDAYTVGYTFYDDEGDACYDYNGDTIMCYGHIARFLYEDYPSIGTSGIWLESGNRQQGVEVFFERFGHDTDSLKSLLNSSSHSDTCFVKGVFKVYSWHKHTHIIGRDCGIAQPQIIVSRLEDIYIK